MVHVDMWQSPLKAERILDGYGHGEEPLPVYKMPHLEGWAAIGDRLLLPAVGRHELIAVDTRSFAEAGRVATHGQPVFAVARPDGRHVWVNFAHPLNDTIDVVDTLTLKVIAPLRAGTGGAAHGIHAARRRGLGLGARRRPRRQSTTPRPSRRRGRSPRKSHQAFSSPHAQRGLDNEPGSRRTDTGRSLAA